MYFNFYFDWGPLFLSLSYKELKATIKVSGIAAFRFRKSRDGALFNFSRCRIIDDKFMKAMRKVSRIAAYRFRVF